MKRDEKIRQASIAFAKEMARGELEKANTKLKCIALELHKYHIDDDLQAAIDAYNSVIADLYRKTGVKMPNYPMVGYVMVIIDGKESRLSRGGLLPKIDTPINTNPNGYAYGEIKSAWSQLSEADICRQKVFKQMAEKLDKMKRLPSLGELTHEKLLEIWEREE